MKPLVLAGFFLLSTIALADTETRCGWISSPTPGNYWIDDADGRWIISTQGGYQAEGVENLAYPEDDQYVDTNGNYGYFCGCITASTSRHEMKVVSIRRSKAKRLKDCLKDPKLDKP